MYTLNSNNIDLSDMMNFIKDSKMRKVVVRKFNTINDNLKAEFAKINRLCDISPNDIEAYMVFIRVLADDPDVLKTTGATGDEVIFKMIEVIFRSKVNINFNNMTKLINTLYVATYLDKINSIPPVMHCGVSIYIPVNVTVVDISEFINRANNGVFGMMNSGVGRCWYNVK